MGKTHFDGGGRDSAGEQLTLAQMQTGQTGKIVAIDAGCGLFQRLNALGIRVGTEVTKISSQWMRGPVVLKLGNTQTAIGFGMASKVLVELTGAAKS